MYVHVYVNDQCGALTHTHTHTHTYIYVYGIYGIHACIHMQMDR